MRYHLLTLLSFFLFTFNAHAESVEKKFENLKELGVVSKPTVKIASAQEALDFILADKIVRKGIIDKEAQGYEDWKAQSTMLGYDGDEPIYEVRVTSATQLPPYTCVFRFDSKGIDHRDKPWLGCQYE